MEYERDSKSVTYKRNHVKFMCTNDEEARLIKELRATGLVVDVKCRPWITTNIGEPLKKANIKTAGKQTSKVIIIKAITASYSSSCVCADESQV